MRNKKYKLQKLEKNRFSLFTDNLEYCIVCGMPSQEINEVFPGRNRQNSMKYGMCIPLCSRCHKKYHIDRDMQLYYMQIGKEIFLSNYSEQEWDNSFRYIKTRFYS